MITIKYEGNGLDHVSFEISSESSDYLPDVLATFQRSLQAMGFNYVKSLAAEKESGDMTWSDEI